MIYSNCLIRVEREESEIPWLKIFVQREVKEFSECTNAEKLSIFNAMDLIEKMMLAYYNPTKINLASFGNYVPQVHWHVMARFKDDSFFPEPMWGEKQRDGQLKLPSFEKFCIEVVKALTDQE